MSKIVDLDEERDARKPHTTVLVRCVNCNYEWLAIAPVPVPNKLECPECEFVLRK